MSSRPPPAVEEVIPHRLPFRFVDRALRLDDDGGEFELVLTSNDERLRSGHLAPLMLVEALAQSAAAWHGSVETTQERGMLVQIDSAELLAPATTGDTVHLSIRRERVYGALVQFAGRATCGDRDLARARFTVHRGALPVESTP